VHPDRGEPALDVDPAVARLERQPAFRTVDGNRAVAGVQRQLAFHVRRADGAVAGPQLEAPLDTNPYFRPFRPAPARQALAETAKLEGEARRLVEKEVVPALGRFRDYLSQEYLPRARAEAGVWSLKRGEEFYAWSSRRSTTTRLEPTEIHSLGMQEVARIRSQMEALRKSLGFQGGLQDFFGYLRRERRFYQPGVSYDAETGLTFDGHPIDRATGELAGAPRNWSAASKESLHIILLAKAISGDPVARGLVTPDPADPKKAVDRALDVLSRKIATYRRFDERNPGFGGFLPWFKVAGGELAPMDGWSDRVPGLDNGQLAWSLQSERTWRRSPVITPGPC